MEMNCWAGRHSRRFAAPREEEEENNNKNVDTKGRTYNIVGRRVQ
jgi:hypothetical protein